VTTQIGTTRSKSNNKTQKTASVCVYLGNKTGNQGFLPKSSLENKNFMKHDLQGVSQ